MITVFEFSNTGEIGLFIENVFTSCACNVPKWTKKVIEANESGEFEVIYDAKHSGFL